MKQVLLLILMFMLLSKNVYANGMPTISSSGLYGEITPFHETDIEIVKERITFHNLRDINYDKLDVVVDYIMKSKKQKKITVAFVCNSNDINVFQDGKKIFAAKKNKDYYDTYNLSRPKFSFEILHQHNEPGYYLFDLSFETQKETKVQVFYTQKGGYDRIEKKSFFIYYLQPAKYWANYNNLSIEIQIPKFLSFESNFNFMVRDAEDLNKIYFIDSEKLPDEDLYFETFNEGLSFLTICLIIIGVFMIFYTAYILFLNKRTAKRLSE